MSANGVGVGGLDNLLRSFGNFEIKMIDYDIVYNEALVNPILLRGEGLVDLYPRFDIGRISRGLVAPGLSGGGVVDPDLSGGVVGPSHSGGGGRPVVVDFIDVMGRVRRAVVGQYHSGGGGGRLVVVDGGGGGGGRPVVVDGGGGGRLVVVDGGGGEGGGGEGGEHGVNEVGPVRRYVMILAPSDLILVLELPVDFGDYLYNDRAAPAFITVRESLDENSPPLNFDVRYRTYKHRAYVTKTTWSGFAIDHGLQAGDEISFEEHGDAFLLTAQRNGAALW